AIGATDSPPACRSQPCCLSEAELLESAMPDITLTTLNKLKQNGEKFACLTAYDATFAHLESTAGVEVLLIGDSLGMVLQGHDSTLPVTVEEMAYHTASVKRGNRGALIMADLPFMSYATLD